MMPVQSVLSSPGHRVIVHTCEVCGAPAPFGFNSNLRRALSTGNVQHAGKWYCAAHKQEGGQR
jgi:hypothetical protein